MHVTKKSKTNKDQERDKVGRPMLRTPMHVDGSNS